MQGTECQFQLRVLKLGRSDMVLWVDWLSQFNLVIFGFEQSSIKFCYKGMEVELKSELGKDEILMIGREKMDQWVRGSNPLVIEGEK